jgi:hypothetical protein
VLWDGFSIRPDGLKIRPTCPINMDGPLVRQSGGGAVLADGSIRQFDIYAAEVAWGGTWRPVLASAVGDEVLLGMALLAGHELRVAVVPSGSVEITPLP